MTANRFVSKKASNKLKTVADLKGKTVVSTSGTTNIKRMTEINAEEESRHEHHHRQGPRRSRS